MLQTSEFYRIENRDTHEVVVETKSRTVALNLLDLFNERGFEIETAVRLEAMG